jgi:two-component system, OmpR family, sensor histidine kinase VicK
VQFNSTVVRRDEAERLKALLEYEILDSLPDPAMNDLVQFAAEITGAPYAYLGFVDSHRLWFKARTGFSAIEMPRPLTACEYTLVEGQLLHIRDAADDIRFQAGHISLGPGLECLSYIGAPLVTPTGDILGTLSVLSPYRFAFSEQHAAQLELLARQVVTRLEFYQSMRMHERTVRGRQRVERALTVERNFVSAVLDTIGALVLVVDTAGRVVRFNRACERVSGYSFNELVGRPLPGELFLDQERDQIAAFFDQARHGYSLGESDSYAEPQTRGEFEAHWISPNGQPRRIRWTATTLADQNGEVTFIITTGVDVTEQREAEIALRSNEARYRQLVEGSLGMVCTHDLRGRLLSINAHAAQTLGYSVEELLGAQIVDYIPDEHKHGYYEYVQALSESGEDQGLIYIRCKDGTVRVIAYRNKILAIPGEDPFVLGHGIDITEKTDAEEKLHVLMRQRESILDSVGDGIYGMDMQGHILFVNQVGASMLGYTREEVQGQDMHSLMHHSRADGTPYPVSECPVFAALERSTPIRVLDEVFWRKDGRSVPVEYIACPLVNEGRVTGIVVAFQDVTERRRLDRMKDEFISTVSHELRTPLTSLRAALGLVAGGQLEKRPDKLAQMLDVAIGNTDRLVRLVNDILDFEHIGSGKILLNRADCSAIDLLHRATGLQQASAAKSGIHFRIDAEPVNLFVDGDRVLQTLTNLVGNAVKFSPPGSEVCLRAQSLGPTEALIEVEDHGSGIPSGKLEMIFERFQQGDASDSRAMGGTGLGLAICRGIVRQHGGRIWAESTPGMGSKFSFTLPRRAPDVKPAPRSITELR